MKFHFHLLYIFVTAIIKNVGAKFMKISYKLINCLLLLLLFGCCDLHAQIHQWSPDSLIPSKNFENYKFKSGKFIPSTKRWNLVWGDQLVPNYNINEKQTEFVAKNYVATQKIWSNQLSSFEKYNSNFICTIYHLALGINPEDNSKCPDPKSNSTGFIGSVAPKGFINEYTDYFKPWLIQNNISLESLDLENMFQHYDTVNFINRVWHIDPQWVMNGADHNWKKYISETCLDWMDGNNNEGCFFDVSIETNVPGMHFPNQWAPSPVNFEWWMNPHKLANLNKLINDRSEFADFQNDIFKNYYQYIFKQFHKGTNDYLVIPNVDQMVTTVYNPIWLGGDSKGETIDGAMMENFGNAVGDDMYLSLDRGLTHISGRNKILIAQAYPDNSKEVLRIVAEYMLIKNENSFINIMIGSGPQWYPEYEIDLGEQSKLPDSLSKLRIKGNSSQSLLKRSYEYGEVICNTSNQPMDYNPYGENWMYIKTSGGGPVDENGMISEQKIEKIMFTGKITINPSDCMILVKDTVTSVRTNHEIEKSFIVLNPNPAYNYLYISNDIDENAKISIYSIFGKQVLQTVNSGNKIDVSGLTTGIYFILIGNKLEKFVKL
jgi:hypothetical protein